MRSSTAKVLLVCTCVVLAGCGGGTAVRKGDRFEALVDMRVTANTEWEQPFSDGFPTMIPRGTILEARFTTTPGASFFECVPVVVNGNSNQVDVVTYFVPEAVREREGFKGFAFSLPVKDIGEKLKKLAR